MSSSKTLAERIAALADETPVFDGQARTLNNQDPLLAILDEIDTTVLASKLVFATDETQLTLQVSGRRLHRIVDANGELDLPDGVKGVALAMGNTGLLDEVGETLAAFAADAPPLSVTSELSDSGSTDAAEGLSVAALGKALNLDDADAPPEERFARRLGGAPAALIRLEKGVVAETSGSAALIATLRITMSTQLPHFVKTRAKTCGTHKDPSFTYFDNVVEPGMGLGLAIFGDTIFLIALERNLLALAQTAFSRIVG